MSSSSRQASDQSTFVASNGFIILLKRELLMSYRQGSDMLLPVGFFLMVVTLFPFAISPDKSVLQMLAPGVIWIAALLSVMLSLNSLFYSDYEDGSLEQLLVSPQSLYVLVQAKVLAHWLVTGLPLVILTPLLAVMMFVEPDVMSTLCLSLLLGTPILSMVGAIGAGLTVGLKKGGLLIAVLVLPLYVPIIIFGSAAVEATSLGFSPAGTLAILGALLCLAFSLAPLAIAAALRISVSQ